MSRINITPWQLARFTGAGTKNSITDLIREYTALQNKIARVGDQTVYFKWALKSKRKRLHDLKRQYQSASTFIESHSAAELRVMISKQDRKIVEVKQSGGSRFIRTFALHSLQSHREKLVEYLNLKEKYGALPSFKTFTKIKEGLWN